VTAVVESVLKSAAAGTVIVEMSTIAPATARRLSGRCAEAGVDYLDCPVSGGPMGAEAGTLAIWVGGLAEAMDRARPVLEVIGRPDRLRHCGAVGAGLAVKLANNFLGAVNAAAAAEALALARDAGVDPSLAVEAVSDGTGANWQLANLFPNKVLRGDFEPGFRITHMAKDLRIAAELAAEEGLDTPMLALARRRLDAAMAEFGEARDYGAVARLVGW
ncbi:MAG TPA: NAD(P)-dependent oxidoreductase, partial [Acidimicrobiia bacterium]|nr:NAD(P)-dependent oxidoreductase [Acidimicrobiia bacterium]